MKIEYCDICKVNEASWNVDKIHYVYVGLWVMLGKKRNHKAVCDHCLAKAVDNCQCDMTHGIHIDKRIKRA